MLWSEIKRWAKEMGYHSVKTGGKYHWHKLDDISINGIESSISKLSKAIFNHITNNKWVDHQANFIKENQ